MSDTYIQNKITSMLSELGLPYHLKGYDFIKEGVLTLSKDCSYKNNITKRLYPEIAKIYRTTPGCVGRNIRYAIEVVFNAADSKIIYKYFGNSIRDDKSMPHNSQFLATLAEHLKNLEVAN